MAIISNTDLAMLKLIWSNEPELFPYLELVLRDNPALVKHAMDVVKPKDFNDDKAWDRILASIDEYAREFQDKYNVLPEWAAEWFDAHYPTLNADEYRYETIFGGNGKTNRFDGVSCVSLW
ncbi:hypothetical protein D9M68_855380 [compost metagenome]